MKRLLSLVLSAVMAISCCTALPCTVSAADSYSNSNVAHGCVHDPSVVKSNDGKYYIFGSHIAGAQSDDLINWTNFDTSIDNEFTNILSVDGKSWKENLAEPLAWTTAFQKYCGVADEDLQYACWAADVIYNEAMEKYCMYACCSIFGTTASVIFLAVADDIEGPYIYSDCIVYSGFNNQTSVLENDNKICYTNTNVAELIDMGYLDNDELKNRKTRYKWFDSKNNYDCSYGKYPNAIDPTAFTDEKGDMWLVYGSYSGGCFVMPLVESTGLPDYDYMYENGDNGYDVYFGKRISATNTQTEGTGEGPYIIYDKVSGYYYYFLTYGGLAGDGGYNIREYRSKNPDGPYVDAMGNDALEDKNTGLKLEGNYKFTCQPTAYLSGGHSSALIDDDGTMYQAYHTRFQSDNGWGHQIRIHQMLRTADGWAVMLPYEYRGERVSEAGYNKSEIIGTYEFVDSTNITHRLDSGSTNLSDIVLPTQAITLNADGTISGAKDYSSTAGKANTGYKSVSGAWSADENGYTATFKIGSVTYSGVFCKQREETAVANEVMTFAGAGNDNSTIWGVRHTQHTYKTTTVKATASKNGSVETKCSLCGAVKSKSTIYYPKTISLSTTSYTYDGKVKKPTVKVVGSNGKTISSSNYTVAYASGRKNVGKYAVKITFKGNYSGTKTLYLTIKPKATSISSVSAKSKGFTVKWKKHSTQVTGYQIQYSTSSKFTSPKTVTVSSYKTTSKTISKLKGKKKYYIRVRTYKTVGKTKYYSSWSKAKSVTTKK
ncbi:MAG: family 43 glycosylhydrolase [Eubacterium sp.]